MELGDFSIPIFLAQSMSRSDLDMDWALSTLQFLRLLKKFALFLWIRHSKMGVSLFCDEASARCPLKHADLNKVRLVEFLKGRFFLRERCCQRI